LGGLLEVAMRLGALSVLLLGVAGMAVPAHAETESRLVPRQPYAKAHVQMMARAQKGQQKALITDIDIWAEGTRLRAVLSGDPEKAQYWVDGLAAKPLRIVKGAVTPAKVKTLARALELALRAAPDLGNRQNDRVAGRPCKIVVEKLPGGYTLRRCIWRGLPLSVELSGNNFEFNAAATIVEDGRVTVADLQPPQGAPAAPTSLNAAR
jgi:hypothetical protein